ncbi:MAG: hypothetical protein AAB212_10795, partial [Bacteroidota bacterium]
MSKQKNFIAFLMNPNYWWIPLTIIFIAAFGGVALIGKGTYEEAPPLANFVKQDGTVIIINRDLIEGKIVLQIISIICEVLVSNNNCSLFTSLISLFIASPLFDTTQFLHAK